MCFVLLKVEEEYFEQSENDMYDITHLSHVFVGELVSNSVPGHSLFNIIRVKTGEVKYSLIIVCFC